MFQRVFPVVFVLAASAVPLFLSLNMNEGRLIYTLDDPYIHMALARNIAYGHYGINRAEATAPSSSVIWPFLLVPFIRLPAFEAVPLFLNLLFASVTGILLLGFFRKENVLFFAGSVFAFNLPGLALTGMEHSLQVLLTVIIAVGAIEYSKSGRASRLLVVSLILAPMVRYECLAVSLPVLALLFASGDRKLSLATASALILLLAGFSLFLLSLGLDPLPASVFAKSSVVAERSILSNLIASLTCFRGVVQLLILIPLIRAATRKERGFQEKLLAAACSLAVLMHLAAGRFGWFHRYGVYIWVFSVVICFHLYRAFLERHRVVSLLVLMAGSANYLTGYVRIPGASSNIYRQQYQMMRFAHGWLNEPVAVNDLGLVALNSRHYVLDLWGLATPEALQGALSPLWVDSAAAARNINLAMVYMDELPGIQHWTRIARIELHPPLVVCPGGGVDFLVAPWASPGKYTALVDDFAPTLPHGIDLIRFR